MGNTVRKLHAKVHRGNLIKKRFKIGGIPFLERFGHISKSIKNQSYSNFEIWFSATCLYCPGESTIHPRKGLLHRKAFQIYFDNSNLANGSCRQRRRSSLFLGLFQEISGGYQV